MLGQSMSLTEITSPHILDGIALPCWPVVALSKYFVSKRSTSEMIASCTSCRAYFVSDESRHFSSGKEKDLLYSCPSTNVQ